MRVGSGRRRGRLRRGRLRPGRWTSSSSGSRAAARAPSVGASPRVTTPTFVDLDEAIERPPAGPVPAIFADEGEAGLPGPGAGGRRGARRPADRAPTLRRVIATGGGAPSIDPRNRWQLYRGRTGRLARRPPGGRSPSASGAARTSDRSWPGRDPVGDHPLAGGRSRAVLRRRRTGSTGCPRVGACRRGGRGEPRRARSGPSTATPASSSPTTRIGRIVLGEGIGRAGARARRSARSGAPASDPRLGARARGPSVGDGDLGLGAPAAGSSVERIDAAPGRGGQAPARRRRRRPVSSPGCASSGASRSWRSAAAPSATRPASWPRRTSAACRSSTSRRPWSPRSTSSIGGKTAVDLPEGKNLVGAFHQPTAVVIDVMALRTLPERQRRAALGEAVKMAALGDERLFELLEADGPAIARGDADAFDCGAVAEVVERAAWAKIEVVLADEREQGGRRAPAGRRAGRLALNLGHSIGHALEAAGGYGDAPPRRGGRLRTAGRLPDRAGDRGHSAGAGRPDRRAPRSPRAGSATGCPIRPTLVRRHLGTDKKHAGGRLRWVLPTADGVVLRADVPGNRGRRHDRVAAQRRGTRPDRRGGTGR